MFREENMGVTVGLISEGMGALDSVQLHSLYPSQIILLVRGEIGKAMSPFSFNLRQEPVEVQFSRNDSDRHYLWRSPKWGDGILLTDPAMEQRLENDDQTLLMCEFRISVLEENPRLPRELWMIKFPRPMRQVLVLIAGPTLYRELVNYKFPPEVEAGIARDLAARDLAPVR